MELQGENHTQLTPPSLPPSLSPLVLGADRQEHDSEACD